MRGVVGRIEGGGCNILLIVTPIAGKKCIFIPIGEDNLDTIYPNQHPLKLFALNQL